MNWSVGILPWLLFGLSIGVCGGQVIPTPAEEKTSRVPPESEKLADTRPSNQDTALQRTFTYKQSGGSPRRIEIHFPAKTGRDESPVPGVLMFHGGGWSGGNLGQFRELCQYLARRGLVAATAEYRMLSAAEVKQLPPGETKKRVCITDAKSAIRWFKQHAAELGVDPNRIVVGGGSAGGHLAVLATNQPGLNDPQDPLDISPAAAAYLLFNPAFAPDDERDAEVDVLRHLPARLPPALVMFGLNDQWKKGWDAVEHQLIRQGNGESLELWLAEGQPHGFFNRDPWKTVTMIAVDDFLVQQHFLQGESPLVPPPTGEKLLKAEPGHD